MCEACGATPGTVSRRSFLAGVAAAPVVLAFPAGETGRGVVASPAILPREAWGEQHPPLGPIAVEEDVRFLLVHHSASPNEYARGDVPGILQGFYAMHTAPDKGWPDIAYNFLVDRFGTIWEGRAGSLAGPVRGDATGGSQGFALLCCFVGDLTTAPPSTAAARSMAALLAWLGGEHDLDLSRDATTTFVSRGSNKWPAGTKVTTPTIAAHRDMSLTSCPGDAGYAFVRGELPSMVAAAKPSRTPGPRPDRSAKRPDRKREGDRPAPRSRRGRAAGTAAERDSWETWEKIGLGTAVLAVVGRYLTQAFRGHPQDDVWRRDPPAVPAREGDAR